MILAMQRLALRLISFIDCINWILEAMTKSWRPNGTFIIFLRVRVLWALTSQP
jgi:hypothetical protein